MVTVRERVRGRSGQVTGSRSDFCRPPCNTAAGSAVTRIEVMKMFTILIVVAIDIVLLMLFGVVHMVLNERRQRHIQHERAAAYFAGQNHRNARL